MSKEALTPQSIGPRPRGELTIFPPNLYSYGGEIFMAEAGEGPTTGLVGQAATAPEAKGGLTAPAEAKGGAKKATNSPSGFQASMPTTVNAETLREYWRGEAERGAIARDEAEWFIKRGVPPVGGGAGRGPIDIFDKFGRFVRRIPDAWRELGRRRGGPRGEELRHGEERPGDGGRGGEPSPPPRGPRGPEPPPRGPRPDAGRLDDYLEGPQWYGRFLNDKGKAEIIAGTDIGERLFNRMFIRVDVQPREEFSRAFGSTGEYEYNDFMRTLTDTLERTSTSENRQRLDGLITRYSQEKTLREILHNANYALLANVKTEDFTGFLQKFSSDMPDTAYRTKGVTLAAHLYEQALLRVIDENKGCLPAVEVAIDPNAPRVTGREGRVEHLALESFKSAIQEGLLRDASGTPLREMEDWEIRRAISMARGMGIASMRTIEILGSVKLPKQQGGMPSLYGQDIVKDLMPFRHLFGKFNIGTERLAVLGFKTDRGQRAWSQRELLEFKDLMAGDQKVAFVNGELVRSVGERYINRLNPFESGSIYSHTDWRAGAATAYLEGTNRADWIGTGVRLEKLRGDFNKKSRRETAKTDMVGVLGKIAELQPLRLYRQMPELGMGGARDRIIERVLKLPAGRLRLAPLSETESKTLWQVEQDLALMQEATIQEGIRENLDFETATLRTNAIRSAERRGPAEDLAQEIGVVFNLRVLENLAEKIGRNEWPFVFGTDDVPYDYYQFVETGPTGIARTPRDFAAESKAVLATGDLVSHIDSFGKMEQVVEKLRVVYDQVKQYDEGKARRITLEQAEGIAKVYGKDWWARLPLGTGHVLGFLTARGIPDWYPVAKGIPGLNKVPVLRKLPIVNGIPGLKNLQGLKSSYARTVFGNHAMAWDEVDKWHFTQVLQHDGMLSPAQADELRRRIGATKKHLWMAHLRHYGPFGLFSFIYEFLRYSTKDMGKL